MRGAYALTRQSEDQLNSGGKPSAPKEFSIDVEDRHGFSGHRVTSNSTNCPSDFGRTRSLRPSARTAGRSVTGVRHEAGTDVAIKVLSRKTCPLRALHSVPG